VEDVRKKSVHMYKVYIHTYIATKVSEEEVKVESRAAAYKQTTKICFTLKTGRMLGG
jgi:hypothetical protein